MKIEVDTKHDSPAEILHAIKLLKAAIGKEDLEKQISTENFSNTPENNTVESEKNIGFMNMFSDNSIQEKETFTNDESEFEDNDDFNQEDDNNEDNNDKGFFDLSNMIEISTEPHKEKDDDDDELISNKEEEIKNNSVNNLIQSLKEEKDILENDIMNNSIDFDNNSSNIETYNSFYKEFDENPDNNIEKERKEKTKSEKSKKKLFNIEFY